MAAELQSCPQAAPPACTKRHPKSRTWDQERADPQQSCITAQLLPNCSTEETQRGGLPGCLQLPPFCSPCFPEPQTLQNAGELPMGHKGTAMGKRVLSFVAKATEAISCFQHHF